MMDRCALAGLLLATTFLHAPYALAQQKSEVLAPIEVQGEADGKSGLWCSRIGSGVWCSR
ncbi:hypothetical protein ACVDG8_005425 [Mesorhizobium sp. ORM8.1]